VLLLLLLLLLAFLLLLLSSLGYPLMLLLGYELPL
jgi:hypothetical protein